MSTPIQTPPPDITANSKTEDIKAAYEAARAAQAPQQSSAPPAVDVAAVPVPPTAGAEPPPTPPPAAIKGDWGEVSKQADGSFAVKLTDGTVFAGSAEDCLAKLGEAKVKTVQWAKEKQQPAAPVAPAAAEVDPLAETRTWMLDQMAVGLGLENGKQLQEKLEMLGQVAEHSQTNVIAADFYRSCPEFPTSEENIEKIYKYMADNGIVRTDGQGNVLDSDVTAAKLKTAHAACVQYGVYKPLTQDEIAAQWAKAQQAPTAAVHAARPQPPPMLSQNAPIAVQEATKTIDHNSSAEDILNAYKAELAKQKK